LQTAAGLVCLPKAPPRQLARTQRQMLGIAVELLVRATREQLAAATVPLAAAAAAAAV